MEKIILETPPSWTDEELFAFCAANKRLVIERNAKGQLLVSEPAGWYSSNLNLKICTQLGNWCESTHSGIAFDSSGGFRLPNGAMRAPDAAWVSQTKWDALEDKSKSKFLSLCPDFVIELRSATESLSELQERMQEWMANGCKLAWLIDPINKKGWIYRAEEEVEEVEGMKGVLSGENLLPGFVLDLSVL